MEEVLYKPDQRYAVLLWFQVKGIDFPPLLLAPCSFPLFFHSCPFLSARLLPFVRLFPFFFFGIQLTRRHRPLSWAFLQWRLSLTEFIQAFTDFFFVKAVFSPSHIPIVSRDPLPVRDLLFFPRGHGSGDIITTAETEPGLGIEVLIPQDLHYYLRRGLAPNFIPSFSSTCRSC